MCITKEMQQMLDHIPEEWGRTYVSPLNPVLDQLRDAGLIQTSLPPDGHYWRRTTIRKPEPTPKRAGRSLYKDCFGHHPAERRTTWDCIILIAVTIVAAAVLL